MPDRIVKPQRVSVCGNVNYLEEHGQTIHFCGKISGAPEAFHEAAQMQNDDKPVLWFDIHTSIQERSPDGQKPIRISHRFNFGTRVLTRKELNLMYIDAPPEDCPIVLERWFPLSGLERETGYFFAPASRSGVYVPLLFGQSVVDPQSGQVLVMATRQGAVRTDQALLPNLKNAGTAPRAE